MADSVSCLVVEGFAPLRVRMVEEFKKRGLAVIFAVNQVDAVHQMVTHGVPLSFVISGNVGTGQGIMLVRGLGRMEKTRERPILLVLDSPEDLKQIAAPPLHDAVMPVTRYGSVTDLVGKVLDQLDSGAAPAPGPERAVTLSGLYATGLNVAREDVEALDQAFGTLDKVLAMVGANKLPGPMMPDVLAKVTALFSDPDVDFEKVAELVAQHQTLAARLLIVANSAFYARVGGKITSIDLALTRIGLREASTQIHAMAAGGYLVGKNARLREMLLHNLEVAYLVALIAQELTRRDQGPVHSQLYSIALFHNIGPTFLLYTVALLHDRGDIPKINPEALGTMVANRAGDLNQLVCTRMKLPREIVAIYAPAQKGTERLINVMHQAMWTADRLLRSSTTGQLQLDADAQALGLTPERLDTLQPLIPRWLAQLDEYKGAVAPA